MKITLTDEEVRKALQDALSEKFSHMHIFEEEDFYFTVTLINGEEVEDIEFIEFTGVLNL